MRKNKKTEKATKVASGSICQSIWQMELLQSWQMAEFATRHSNKCLSHVSTYNCCLCPKGQSVTWKGLIPATLYSSFYFQLAGVWTCCIWDYTVTFTWELSLSSNVQNGALADTFGIHWLSIDPVTPWQLLRLIGGMEYWNGWQHLVDWGSVQSNDIYSWSFSLAYDSPLSRI